MSTNAPYQWAHARLEGAELVFRGTGDLDRALTDGFFFVDAPPDLDTAAGDLFAQRFFLEPDGGAEDAYRGFSRFTADRLGEHEGYFRRADDQVEQFFLERRWWDDVYPPALARQARAMQDFALAVLRSVLARLAIPPELWDEACGRCLSGRGTYHLTFNHFRPEVRARGLNVHKDSGWVTVLRSLEPGLEAHSGGEWRPVDPRPGSFIVNFGCAMEILTRDTEISVAAVAHRVREQTARPASGRDRFSYALFVDSSLDESICPGLFRYEPGRGLVLQSRFSEFLERILHDTYQPDTEGLY
ncbi:2OG-Fe(II) oxygenase family protein [Salinarimonas chemoclinalis]|uniref:2OG-Fe(II) oxygenase family protein n=1 Tax=Salinarimonas chemoclinalis TaxID=3241599 RepID=UPI0035561359